jgi:cytochrome c oxidase subunit 3
VNASAATWPLAEQRPASLSIGLWVFIGVASALFALFLAAYAMRMDQASDWTRLSMPWQLWLSTALLVTGSALLEGAARRGDAMLRVGAGLCAVAFVASQLWAWQAMADARVSIAGNPAASFFYLLTAMHGLHVAGGLVAWLRVWHRPGPERTAKVTLLARYWHFLLLLWLVLFAALGWLTPEIVAFICGRG